MISAIILAGGVGSRVGADCPKQFIEVCGKPILAYTIENFQSHKEVDSIEVVCHEKWIRYCKNMVEKYNFNKVKWIVAGGKDFQGSCINGIYNLESKMSDEDYVLIQYGAAPYTSHKIISSVIEVMKNTGAAISSIPCYQLLGSNNISESREWIDRDKVIQIASPYGFRYGYIKSVYERAEKNGLLDKIEPHITSIIYALGDTLYQAYGDQTNIKITTAEDVEFFKRVMNCS